MSTPVVEADPTVSDMLTSAFKQGASDVHMERLHDGARIRFRIDGRLQVFDSPEIADFERMTRHIKQRCQCDPDEPRPQDGRIIFRVDGAKVMARVTSCPNTHGEEVVLRFVHIDVQTVPLTDIFLRSNQLKTVQRWSASSNGLILCTGPAGSGKTTVMWSILDALNDDSRKVISVEHPAYASIEGVSQINVDPKLGMTPAAAMRVAMRLDPDVVLFSEIRNAEDASLAVSAALTGHLVISSMHTNSGASTAMRLLDLGISPITLSQCLLGVVNQRLVRRLCAHCKEAHEPTDMLAHCGLPPQTCYQASGCDKCGGQGYHGRRAIFELYELSDDSRRLLLKGCTTDDLQEQARAEGIDDVWADGLAAVSDGVTSLDELLRVTAGRK